MKSAPYRLAAVIAVSLLAAACGSSSSSKSAPAAAAGGTASRPGATTTAPASPSSGTAVKLVVKKNKVGTVLAAGPKKLTVYLFEGDKGTASNCTGRCAKAWPPVTTSGAPSGTAPVQASLIGTAKRADGTTQVTYKGHPLYFFIKDKDDGDAYGEGVKAFGASWYVLKADGSKIDKS